MRRLLAAMLVLMLACLPARAETRAPEETENQKVETKTPKTNEAPFRFDPKNAAHAELRAAIERLGPKGAYALTEHGISKDDRELTDSEVEAGPRAEYRQALAHGRPLGGPAPERIEAGRRLKFGLMPWPSVGTLGGGTAPPVRFGTHQDAPRRELAASEAVETKPARKEVPIPSFVEALREVNDILDRHPGARRRADRTVDIAAFAASAYGLGAAVAARTSALLSRATVDRAALQFAVGLQSKKDSPLAAAGVIAGRAWNKLAPTVTGGFNLWTGRTFAGACGGGKCAESHVFDALKIGSDKITRFLGPYAHRVLSGVRFTPAARPRTGEEKAICPNCERMFGRGAFASPRTRFESDGFR